MRTLLRIRGSELRSQPTHAFRRSTSALLALATVVVAALVTARRPVRFVVRGASMRPVLEPGDQLLALRGARLRAGDLAVVRDPRRPERRIVKRVAEVGDDGSVVVLGDNPAASTDSRQFGAVAPDLVVGRVVYRYLPAYRAGAMLGA